MNSQASNPWNGLRTYAEGEFIYGRNDEIHALSLLIQQNTQTVVYGRSGIGKSSVLNAGIFPIMRSKGMFPVYMRLEHNSGVSYVRQISAAVFREVDRLGYSVIEHVRHDSGEETLWEFFHRLDYRNADRNPVRPLIVFDQFEEIFTLEKSKARQSNFFRQLADLINNVMPDGIAPAGDSTGGISGAADDPQELDLDLSNLGGASLAYNTDSNFHLVFTLREDFLPHLERNTSAIPGLKNNRYCLQPINEEQAAAIIMSPRPGLVATDVAKLIIEKVTREKNFELDGVPEIEVDSAILSLYLSRLYSKMVAEGDTCITTALVETYSDNIIDDFYTSAVGTLPAESVEWLEDTLVNADGRRDSRDRNTVMREGHISGQSLRRLCDEVKLLRQFSYGDDLRIEYIHDVLCPVIVGRRNKRNEEKRIRAAEALAAAEKRKGRRRMAAISAACAIVLAITGAYFGRQYWLYDAEVSECYREFTLCAGRPVGVGPRLTDEQQRQTPLYYRLSHRGHATAGHNTLDICSSNARIPAGARLTLFDIPAVAGGSDYNALRYDSLLSGVSRLEFMENNEGMIDRITALDNGGNTMFSLSGSEQNSSRWYAFTDPRGMPMAVRDNGLDRVRVSSDSLGRIVAVAYYDRNGARRDIADAAHTYGFNYEYTDGYNDCLTEPISMYGDRLAGAFRTQYAGTARITSYVRRSASAGEAASCDPLTGYSTIIETPLATEYYKDGVLDATLRRTLDDAGNVLAEVLEAQGTPAYGFPARRSFSYDRLGRRISEETDCGTHRTSRIMAYGDDGTLVRDEMMTDGVTVSLRQTVRSADGKVTRTTVYDSTGYVVRTDSVAANTVYAIFRDRDGRPVNGIDATVPTAPERYYTRICRISDNTRCTEYYHIDSYGTVRKGRAMPAGGTAASADCGDGSYRILETLNPDGTVASEIRYLPSDSILTSQMFYYTNGELSGRSVMGVDGTPVRCPDFDIDHFGYYRIAYTNDFNGNYTGVVAFDEYGNMSPIDFYGRSLRFGYANMKGHTIMFDPGHRWNGHNPTDSEITLMYDYWQFYPETYSPGQGLPVRQAVFLHVLSKNAPLYKAGLRDGDMILCGSRPAASEAEARAAVCRPVLKVLRVTRLDSGYSASTVTVKAGKDAADDIHLHLMPLSLPLAQFISEATL